MRVRVLDRVPELAGHELPWSLQAREGTGVQSMVGILLHIAAADFGRFDGVRLRESRFKILFRMRG